MAGTIDEAAKTIAVVVPYGTNVTALVATFSTTGASVKVGATAQTSGTTANDFTGPVIYTVTAADSSTASYTVTVAVALNPAKALTAYSLGAAAGTIDEAAKTIAVVVPYGTNVAALVATFTTTGASVKIGSTAQTSGSTANDFTSPLVYTVTAADGSTASYTVTVTVGLNSAKAMTAYSIGGNTGTVNEAAKTIAVTVPNGTNVTALVATFSTTGASVKVGATVQTSASTANNFTSPVAYTVTAADTTTATYTVTVTAVSSAGALPKTGRSTLFMSGDDGDLQKGVAWPSPRFTTNGDGTVTDNLTGLAWAADANAPGPVACGPGAAPAWQGALDYVTCLNANNYLGHADWRLPNVNELGSLVHAGVSNTAGWLTTQGFSNLQGGYWSSTTAVPYGVYGWVVYMSNGRVDRDVKTYSHNAWPVRDGSSGGTVSLRQTGQTICYDATNTPIACAGTGQDGALLKGVAWPSPRFTANGDGTVTDNLTGLTWSADANTPGAAGCAAGTTDTWQNAMYYVGCLNNQNYLGHNDWRMPNRNELLSLVNFEQTNNATWLNSQGFSNVANGYYWASTTSAGNTGDRWTVYMQTGVADVYASGYTYRSWPVRAGQ